MLFLKIKLIDMKKFISLLFLLGFFCITGKAQSEKYVKVMQEKVSLIEQTRTVEGWQELSNSFERIGEAEKDQWLPFYYAALGRVMMGNMMANGQTVALPIRQIRKPIKLNSFWQRLRR